ncbi:hypothetical protein L226DRAFT_178148 [Lentinus tigrinus ALCF2SS1-7]|uniref:Uncharacterized protein n=1 Tax=Lentinus tigrinus ALCF2SS1-6 TaxID=1328759 RepID=A0A5C2SPL8_9APHY|nr:hypothetical protein L227DRAFT_120420 [Lentinus tigrinus ALCF2SS1-6]RPD79724.1 hypothetical protein L226DRAFT_178148 [Lentinus tigrinus ALCF2SS1-7]
MRAWADARHPRHTLSGFHLLPGWPPSPLGPIAGCLPLLLPQRARRTQSQCLIRSPAHTLSRAHLARDNLHNATRRMCAAHRHTKLLFDRQTGTQPTRIPALRLATRCRTRKLNSLVFCVLRALHMRLSSNSPICRRLHAARCRRPPRPRPRPLTGLS